MTVKLAFCYLVGVVSLAAAQSAPADPQPDTHRLFIQGFDHVYNLEYAEADRAFRKIIELEPTSPAGYRYVATNLWLWELFRRGDLELESFLKTTRFVDDAPADAEAKARFEKVVRDGIARAEQRLKANPREEMALYSIGSLYGTWGAYEATIMRSGWASFRAANRGFKYHEKLLQINPRFYDAYLTTGMYNYITGSLPFGVKVLAFALGFRGDRKKGFQLIEMAAAKGRFVDDDARFVLAILYARDNKWARSLEYLQALFTKFPRNYLLHIEIANAYDMLGQDDLSIGTYQEILSCMQKRLYRYGDTPPSRVHEPLGSVYLKKKDGERARSHLEKALEDPRVRTETRILATLRLGQAYDLLGRREKAVEQYKKTLLMRDFKNSRSQARKYVQKPFDGYHY